MVAAEKHSMTQGVNRATARREGKVDTERYDYLDGMLEGASRLSASTTYKYTREMKDLLLGDPQAKKFPTLRSIVDPHFENMMSPLSETAKQLKTFVGAYSMALSIPTTIINGMQSWSTLAPILIQYDKHGMGPMGSWGSINKAIGKASSFTFDDSWQGTAKEVKRKLAAAGTDVEARNKVIKEMTLEESYAYYYDRNVEDGGVNHGIIQDEILSSTDQKSILMTKFGRGEYADSTKSIKQKMLNGAYVGAQLGLKPFGWVESFNNKIGLVAGLEQGYKQGLRGDALYQHARLIQRLSTFGGGRSNAPGWVGKVSNQSTRSAFAVVNTLQQYGYGVLATYSQLIKDSLGKSKGLDAMQVKQARKALGTMLMTQTALAGALGMPFVGAALTMMEQVFGLEAHAAVREGLAMFSDDDETGAMIAEVFLNGLGNQMVGLDLSSRFGVSNLMGTSTYRGFNPTDMLGPVGGVVGNLVDSLGYFGQGETAKGTKSLVPNAFKTIVEMADSKAKYGEYGVHDTSGNLMYRPSPTEAAMYMAGFRPKEVSEKRQAQRLLTFSSEQASKQRGREFDKAAQALLQGDSSQALLMGENARLADPTVDPRSMYRSIVQRAVDSVTEKDVLATGSTANEQRRQAIAGTFPQRTLDRQSEMQRTQLGAQLGARLGLPPEAGAYRRAQLVDMLVQTRGMPRSQAVRLAEFLQ